MKTRTAGFLACAAAIAAGCDPGTEGELGRGDFVYTCPFGADDPVCSFAGDEQGVPQVAVGGQLALRYESHDYGAFRVEPASDRHVAAGVSSFTVGIAGPTGFFSVDWDSDVYDLIHLWVRPIATLDVRCEGWAGFSDSCGPELAMQAGETGDVEAFPLASDGQLLGGALGYSWESADPSVASVEPAGSGRAARILAGAPGATTLTVSAGGATASLGIVVGGGIDTETGTETGTESETETGTETDADAGTDGEIDAGAADGGGV